METQPIAGVLTFAIRDAEPANVYFEVPGVTFRVLPSGFVDVELRDRGLTQSASAFLDEIRRLASEIRTGA